MLNNIETTSTKTAVITADPTTPLKSEHSTQKERCHFFRDIQIVLGITVAIAFLDFFIKWASKFASYHNYEDITKADVADIGIASSLILITMTCVVILKNIFPPKNKKYLTSNLEAAKNTGLILIPTSINFALNALIKYMTDIHSEKNIDPSITGREWLDIGENACFVFISLVVLLIAKDWKFIWGGRNIQDNPNHAHLEEIDDTSTTDSATNYFTNI